ncbi:MAG: hypothetical protein ACE5GE_11060 [Phycisphaerae bacterium]
MTPPAPRHRPIARRLLGGLLLVFVLTSCLRVWLGPLPTLQQAHAQIPDSGRQRFDMIREAQRTNQLLDQILTTLRQDTLNVRVVGTDKNAKKDTGRGRKARRP